MDSKDQDSKDQDPSNREHGHPRDAADGYSLASQLGREPQLGQEPECREALNRLYHFLDGELTEERRIEIEEHLKTCMPCLEAFDFEAELKLLIARRCRDEVPQQLRVRVALALSEASVPSPPEGDRQGAGAAGSGGTAKEQEAGFRRFGGQGSDAGA